METNSWRIYWNEYSADTYLYGSQIYYHKKNDVEFVNELMPPGTVIKTWYSKVNYQKMRIEPSLPIIDGESRYRIRVDYDEEDKGNLLIRIVFYDRYEIEAGSIILNDDEEEFSCPLKTYSYTVQLINGGVRKFRFHSITIWELENGTEEQTSTIE